jgi:hypothetical protein
MRLGAFGLAVVMVSGIVCMAHAESYLVVKIEDRASLTTYQVMTPTGLKTLQGEIQNELRVHPKALDKAKLAWAQTDEGKTKGFPTGAIGRRSATASGSPFPTEEAAQEKCDRATEKLAAKAADEADKLEARLIARYTTKDARNEKKAEAAERAKEKTALDEKARALYEAELTALLKPAGAAPAAKSAAP